jgi:hypothetical protein
MTGNAKMPADDLDEVGVAFGSPDGGHVSDEPNQEPSEPEAKADA